MRSFKFLLFSMTLIIGVGCSSDDYGQNNDNDDNQDQQQQEPAKTAIADPAFEQALIALNYDVELDGFVLTENIEDVTSLVLNEQGISDISGIEDFTSLENLWINDNELVSLPISTNGRLKFIFADFNQITNINIAALSDLEKVSLINNQLASINVSNNFELELLVVPGNQLEELDVSANPVLFTLSVVNNPLDCIKVSSSQQADIPDTWEADPEDSYSLSCN